ncbi:unnamed protein product [Rotaria sp. Silwood2]|nr:unnamed protein product [Rotaria sp. Silwood2]
MRSAPSKMSEFSRFNSRYFFTSNAVITGEARNKFSKTIPAVYRGFTDQVTGSHTKANAVNRGLPLKLIRYSQHGLVLQLNQQQIDSDRQLRETLSNLSESNRMLIIELDRIKKEIFDLTEDNNRATQGNTSLNKQIDDLKDENICLNKQINDLKEENMFKRTY